MLRIGSWTLSNLCDGQPRPVVDIHAVLPVLAKLLQNSDAEVLSHTCWALSHLCDGPSSHIKVGPNIHNFVESHEYSTELSPKLNRHHRIHY